jgi:hypothetical protein
MAKGIFVNDQVADSDTEESVMLVRPEKYQGEFMLIEGNGLGLIHLMLWDESAGVFSINRFDNLDDLLKNGSGCLIVNRPGIDGAWPLMALLSGNLLTKDQEAAMLNLFRSHIMMKVVDLQRERARIGQFCEQVQGLFSGELSMAGFGMVMDLVARFDSGVWGSLR